MIYLAKFLAILLIVVIAYAFGAFVALDANPVEWTAADRLLTALLFLWLTARLEFANRGAQK